MKLTKRNKGDFASNWMIMLLDVGLSGIASLVAILLMRWMSEPFFGFQRFTLIWLMFSVLGSVIGFYLTKTYKIVIRYFNFNDTSSLVKATLIKELLMGACILFNLVGSGHVRLDILTLVLDALFTVFVLVIVRVVMIKILKTNSMSIEESVERLRVIVYGTSVKAIAMVDRLDESPHYDIIGFNTDCCVLKVALDLFDRGYAFHVLTDYCYSSTGEEEHRRGVAVLRDLLGQMVV